MLYGRQNLLEPHLASRTKRQVSQLVRLAVPIIVARSGIVLMMAVDIIMVGHFSTHELAYQHHTTSPYLIRALSKVWSMLDREV